MAIVPEGTKGGDIVTIPLSSPVPHILRSTASNMGQYYFIGEAYVHGVMQGEALKGEERWFDIV
jgi:hypothetical protein